LKNELSDYSLSDKEKRELSKIFQILLFGQLLGLPTLNSILKKHGIKSNSYQKQYKNICKKLNINDLKNIFSQYSENQVLLELKKMSKKDNSCWSRTLTTLIIDDSVFKHWFGNENLLKEFEEVYGSFFSGQYGRAVYGIKVVTMGINIGDIFYPLYFDFVKKVEKEAKIKEKSTEVAGRLVKKWHTFVQKISKKGIELPKIHFSCDNGYSNFELQQVCESCNLIYISVPKKVQQIEFNIDNKTTSKMKIEKFINEIYMPLENVHKKSSDEPFTMRVSATLCAHNQEVTLLFFRLNGSKKISVIYTSDKNIFSKTLRRHWFNRTQIEQFFKLLKHTLKIQEARTHHVNCFFCKICFFSIIAVYFQRIIKELRRKKLFNREQGAITLQRILVDDIDFKDLLQTIIDTKY
jgi:hypothetical protein